MLISCLLFFVECSAQNYVSEEDKQRNSEKLNDVQKAIAKQVSTIFKKKKTRAVLEKHLQNDDLAIENVAKKIKATKKSIEKTQSKISSLSIEEEKLTSQKNNQEQLLAQQLHSAYTNGQHDYLKLLLNQDQSEKIQRTITYYQYLNKARINEIDQFQATIAQLMLVTTQHQNQIKNLEVLEKNQQEQKHRLSEIKNKRSKTIALLNKELSESKQRLTKLKTDEANLTATLKRLTEILRKEINLTGLNKLKRRLSWPVRGKLLRSFGSKKQGHLKWKGVLIDAPMGRSVQTIHNGTVIYSDWLKGYGLLTVVDHGNEYMSLYAHNQALFKSVGDRVETGEPIALVGQSGGQNRAGLYFEIRHKGKAVNPKLWCR